MKYLVDSFVLVFISFAVIAFLLTMIFLLMAGWVWTSVTMLFVFVWLGLAYANWDTDRRREHLSREDYP